jgi:drug/metabolite transporter (DMT)-like permease
MTSFGGLLRFIWRSTKRTVIFVVGVALLVVGLIMMVTPGPGIVFLVAGLAVLATEFAWAEHLLKKAREQAEKAGQASQKIPGVSHATGAVKAGWRKVRRQPATPAVEGAGPAGGTPAEAN